MVTLPLKRLSHHRPMRLHLAALSFLILQMGCGDQTKVEEAKEQARRMTAVASNTVAKIQAGDLSDLDGFRVGVRTLRASLVTNDFSTAREHAEQIDRLLKTEFVAQSVEFLRIESTEGIQKARAAITNQLAKSNLGEAEAKAFRQMIDHLDQMNREQRIDLMTSIIYIALESKMSHGAAVPAAFARVLMEDLFGGGSSSNSPPISK